MYIQSCIYIERERRKKERKKEKSKSMSSMAFMSRKHVHITVDIYTLCLRGCKIGTPPFLFPLFSSLSLPPSSGLPFGCPSRNPLLALSLLPPHIYTHTHPLDAPHCSASTRSPLRLALAISECPWSSADPSSEPEPKHSFSIFGCQPASFVLAIAAQPTIKQQ